MRNRSKRGYRKNFNDRNGNRGDNPRESEVFLLHKNVKVLQRHYHTIGRTEIPKIHPRIENRYRDGQKSVIFPSLTLNSIYYSEKRDEEKFHASMRRASSRRVKVNKR